LRREVDVVVHGGDVFFRSEVPPRLVRTAFEPLFAIARLGIPVLVVPGNHERSEIPCPLLAVHPGVHVFDRPKTVVVETEGQRLAFGGFPFVRENVRGRFRQLVAQTQVRETAADTRLLCMHQAFEGARVGPTGRTDFTFRYAPDVVAAADVPPGLAGVLSGHIHRHQVLTRGLDGRPLPCPVLYPGSIERTSFAEKEETKGALVLEVAGSALTWQFRPLRARPMRELELDPTSGDAGTLAERLRRRLAELEPDAVVRVRMRAEAPAGLKATLTDAWLRALAPKSMNVRLSPPTEARERY